MSDYRSSLHDISRLSRDTEITLVVAEFNREYTESLEIETRLFLEGEWFTNIDRVLVPWAFEIPGMIRKLVEDTDSINALIIAIGVVIRGETTHYELVTEESARGIMDLTLRYDTAIINGILTCEDEEQVKARIGPQYAIAGLNLLAELSDLYE